MGLNREYASRVGMGGTRGKRPTTDITAADLHALCDIFTQTSIGLEVNFHFDYEDGRIRVEDNRGDAGRLAIQFKVAQPVSIRTSHEERGADSMDNRKDRLWTTLWAK